MPLTNFNSRFLFVTAAILIAAASRLFIHIPNFTPVAAIALFGGAFLGNRLLSFFIPLVAMFVSDIFIGFYGWGMVPVYGSFALIIVTGIIIRKNINPVTVILASLTGSILFFLITNFAFIYPPTMYPHTFAGIISSYVAGLPFLKGTLASDLCYNGILFGTFYFARMKFPKLAEV